MPKKRQNPGWFQPGEDSRRHQFSRRERRKGYKHAMESPNLSADQLAWVWRKVRGYYRAQRRAAAGLAGDPSRSE